MSKDPRTMTGRPGLERPTIVWGVAADAIGMIHRSRVISPDVGYGAITEDEFKREPSSDYADEHPAPMPMMLQHREKIGHIVALRRGYGRLSVVAECELEPDELEEITVLHGSLKWSTTTKNGRRERLRIHEISLTPNPASVGLPPVEWYKQGVTHGDMPSWVKQDLTRARKARFDVRSRDVIRVFEVQPADRDAVTRSADASSDPYWISPREVFHSGTRGRILKIG